MALRQICSVRLLQRGIARLPPVHTGQCCIQRIQPSQRVARPAFTSIRWHSAPSNPPRVYEYNQVKQISEAPSPEQVIIDVREPSEYQDGYIPGAINIPLKSSPDAIFMPEDEFEDKFGFGKPDLEQELIFYCRAGVRSSAAAQLAQQHGYSNISDYRGSWLDWEKNGGRIEKP